MKTLCLFWFWCFITCAFAQDEGHLRFLKSRVDYRVNLDATYSAVVENSFLLLTESALIDNGKLPITYSRKLEEVEILEAYTIKKDGRRIDVGPGGIQIQDGQLASGYDISQADQRKLMITFPQLEIGDAVAYKYRLTAKEAVFPGQFYASHGYSREFTWDAVDVTIDMPASLALHTEAVEMTALPIIEQNGRRIHRWQARNLPVVEEEPASVNVFPNIPHLIASTFKGWNQLAAAYERRARPKAAVTPAIAQMADRITQGVKDQRTQTRLLYEWVAKNVRYVASWIGAEGWIPHDAESILNHRYGDCKDHVVLLEALLAAKGIVSSAVMVNRDKMNYSLPKAVYPVFNHVITYVPAFGLYLDSTTGSTTPFGVLPIADMDKPVIHTSAYDGVRRTPMLKPAQLASTRTTRMTISEDGSMTGELSITAVGVAAIEMRELQQSIGQHKEAEWVRELLDGHNFEGEGTIAFEEAADGSAITTRLKVHIDNFLAVAENGTIPLAPLLAGPITFNTQRAIHKRPKRTLPFWCPAWTLEDRYEIRLPGSFRLILPKGGEIKDAGFSYRSRYEFDGGVLNAIRRLSIERASMACQPAEYAARKAVVSRIERDLRAQIIYQLDEHSH